LYKYIYKEKVKRKRLYTSRRYDSVFDFVESLRSLVFTRSYCRRWDGLHIGATCP